MSITISPWRLAYFVVSLIHLPSDLLSYSSYSMGGVSVLGLVPLVPSASFEPRCPRTSRDGTPPLSFDPFEQPRGAWLVETCCRLGPVGWVLVLIARGTRANFQYWMEGWSNSFIRHRTGRWTFRKMLFFKKCNLSLTPERKSDR
jgi:hypothetical protein